MLTIKRSMQSTALGLLTAGLLASPALARPMTLSAPPSEPLRIMTCEGKDDCKILSDLCLTMPDYKYTEVSWDAGKEGIQTTGTCKKQT